MSVVPAVSSPQRRPAAWLAVALAALTVGCANKPQERADYWKARVNAEIVPGESEADVKAWVSRNVPGRPGTATVVGGPVSYVLEKVDAGGLHFPCAAYVFMLQPTYGPDHTVIDRKVITAGACL